MWHDQSHANQTAASLAVGGYTAQKGGVVGRHRCPLSPRRPFLSTLSAAALWDRVSETQSPCRTTPRKRHTRDRALVPVLVASRRGSAGGFALHNQGVQDTFRDIDRKRDRGLKPYGSPPRTTEFLRAILTGRDPGMLPAAPLGSAGGCFDPSHGPGASYDDRSIAAT